MKLVSSKVKTSQTMDPSKHLLKVDGMVGWVVGWDWMDSWKRFRSMENKSNT